MPHSPLARVTSLSTTKPHPRSPTASMGRIRWAYLAAICSCWGWASLYPGSELALAEVEPFIIVWVRATVAGLALGGADVLYAWAVVRAGLSRMYATSYAPSPARCCSWERWLLCVTSSLSVSSQVFLPGSVAALLTGIGPLWIALGAFALGHAARPWYLLGGSLLACVGVGAVALGQDLGADSSSWWQLLVTADLRGVILALGCSLAIAGAILVARRTVAGRDAVAITAVACCWAALALVPLVLVVGPGFQPLFAASRSTQLILVYLGLGSTAFNFALWYFALSRLPATRIAHFQYLVAPLGVLLECAHLGRAADGEPGGWRRRHPRRYHRGAAGGRTSRTAIPTTPSAQPDDAYCSAGVSRRQYWTGRPPC